MPAHDEGITKTQISVYFDSKKNICTEFSLHSYIVFCGDSLYMPPDILTISYTSTGAVLSLALEY